MLVATQTIVWKDTDWKGSMIAASFPLLLSTVVHTALILLLAMCISTEKSTQKWTFPASFAVGDEAAFELSAPTSFGEPMQLLAESDSEKGLPVSWISLDDNHSSELGIQSALASFKAKQGTRELGEVDREGGNRKRQSVHSVYASKAGGSLEKSTIRFGSKRLPGSRHAGFASSKSLEVIVPGLDPYGSSVLNQASNLSLTGGAMMVSTAKPHPSLANVPLLFDYDPSNVDGNRLTVVAGKQPSILSSYDWELIPLAQFVDSGHHGAVDIKMFGKHEKISLDAAFEQTLLGLRFIQADLMPRGVIMSQEYLPQDDRGILLGPGELERLSSDRVVRESVKELEPLMARTRNGALYSVLTDAKIQYEFEVVGNELVISGTPYFFFWEPANRGDQVVPKKALNDSLKKAWPRIKQANPLVIESMERSFRTVAFFRYQKQNSPTNWARLMQQLRNVSLEKVPTPSLLSGE